MTAKTIYGIISLAILFWLVFQWAREKRHAFRRRLLDIEADLVLIKEFLLKSTALAAERETFEKESPGERDRLYRKPFFPKEKKHFIEVVQFHEWVNDGEKFPLNSAWMAQQDEEYGIKEQYTWAFRLKKTKLELKALFDRYPSKVFEASAPDYTLPTPSQYIEWLDYTESPAEYLDWSSNACNHAASAHRMR
ncbi:MAG: hypothetical protein HY077_18950 [Elusimicrobia bacterium]|nr:hypothetical protein [Elusimicrobiota bacterium]